MGDIWKAIALLRSEAILESSFKNFMYYIQHYQATEDIAGIILEVFGNFTATV
jgi:hypothetical protein